jgi:hypothetical protein
MKHVGDASVCSLLRRPRFFLLRGALLAALSSVALAQPAFALSEIKREELPAPSAPAPAAPGDSEKAVPLPDPISPPANVDPQETGPTQPTAPAAEDDDGPPPEVQYDFQALPEPVRRMRELVLDVCRSGDIEKLRPLLGNGDDMTQISLAGVDGDAIDYLKGLSGDDQGQEILAILEEVLTAGYVHLDVGTPEELYVWPYFFAVPLEKLTPPQKVELFKIVTAGDYEEMKTYGSYIFYRVGITPQGRWAFFVAGE